MMETLTHPTEEGGYRQMSLLPTRLTFPCASAWDIPTQEEVNAALAGEMAAKGGLGDGDWTFAFWDDDGDVAIPPTLTEYEAYTGRSEYQPVYTR